MKTLTQAAQQLLALKQELKDHLEFSKKKETSLRNGIKEAAAVLEQSSNGINADKVTLAQTILYVQGDFTKAGEDRQSVLDDAVKQLASGKPIRETYGDLWLRYFGTKNYAHWSGQRCDCPYLCCPTHGSIVFEVGILANVRDARKQSDLTPDEIEAAIYFLVNLPRIQEANARAENIAAA